MKSAESFAIKVDGKVNDLRGFENSKSQFTVTYKPSEKTKDNWFNGVIETPHPEVFWRY